MTSRPTHPDFWLISQSLISQDAQVASGQSVDDAASRYADPASVAYVAQQRSAMIMAERGALVLGAREVGTMIAAAWMDAFIQGIRFQHLKSQRNEEES